MYLEIEDMSLDLLGRLEPDSPDTSRLSEGPVNQWLIENAFEPVAMWMHCMTSEYSNVHEAGL